MNILNAAQFPLTGQRLIEASAGTGKTFTIASLYLRLLLGDHPLGRLSTDRILVVTFTRAATEELRGRIRDRIRELYEDLLRLKQGQALPDSVAEWFERTEQQGVEEWLRLNLSQMDEASVFTIHGFSQRVLKQFAFDSAIAFESEMILETQEHLRRAAQDYWRELAYPLTEEEARALLSCVAGPEDVYGRVRYWLRQEDIALLPQAEKSGVVAEKTFSDYWKDVSDIYLKGKTIWQTLNEADMCSLLESSGVDKRSFSKTTRPKRVKRALAFFSGQETFSGVIPDDVLQLGQENLHIKTKKGEAPEHEAFRIIDQLSDSVALMRNSLPHHMLKHVRHLFLNNLEKAGLMSPDDLLRILAEALRGPQGEALAESIRRQYPVAMIDEFQDTDGLQYEIFSRVYRSEKNEEGHENCGLYMIGDPKQAIYSFRGADIFTYLTASKQLEESARYTLNTNWRSHSGLISATNALFSQNPAPFVMSDMIRFHPVEAAGKSDNGYLHLGDNTPLAGMQFLLGKEAHNRDSARYSAADECASSIQALLKKGRLVDKPVESGDIAVLVRNRKQASCVKEALKAQGINSVFLSRDSVFASVQAQDLLRWLQALAHPQNERLLRSALACESLGFSADYLASLLDDESAWEYELERLYLLKDIFNRRGVMAFVMAWFSGKLPEDETVAVRIRRHADGERAITNFLHLAEILQQTSRTLGIFNGAKGNQAISVLLRWFTERCRDALLNESEEQQIRLESDAGLVQIVTIHKSKGLQYPIVFMPFSWDEDLDAVRGDAVYHIERNDSSVLAINTAPDDDAKSKHIREVRAEAMRLLYVALTRAEQTCFIQLENIRNRDKPTLSRSAIGYLLESSEVSIEHLQQRFTSCLKENQMAFHWYEDWMQLLDQKPDINSEDAFEEITEYKARSFNGSFRDRWRVTSYSQLAQAAHSDHSASSTDDTVIPEDDRIDWEAGNDLAEYEMLNTEAMPEHSSFSFPKGATPGSCLHGILENWDFRDPEVLCEQIEKQLTYYAISEEWAPLLNEWMPQAVQQPLINAGCSLSDIGLQDRLVEMEFYLPITELRAGGVAPLLDNRRLAFDPMKGHIKGFIDLIFRHNGRYYVADYKSNYLGDHLSDYLPEKLKAAMESHQYDLQYWIYSVATDAFLSQRIPDYSYEQHFGGVYYFFLRGMNGSHNEQCSSPENTLSDNALHDEGAGVFFTRPEYSQLMKWKHWLCGSQQSEQTSGTQSSEQADKAQDNNEQPIQNQLDLW